MWWALLALRPNPSHDFCVPLPIVCALVLMAGPCGEPRHPTPRARSTCSLHPACGIPQTTSRTKNAGSLSRGWTEPGHLRACPAPPGPLLVSPRSASLINLSCTSLYFRVCLRGSGPRHCHNLAPLPNMDRLLPSLATPTALPFYSESL